MIRPATTPSLRPRTCSGGGNPRLDPDAGLPRRPEENWVPRNDGSLRVLAPSREPKFLFDAREAAKARRGFGLQRLGHSLPAVGII